MGPPVPDVRAVLREYVILCNGSGGQKYPVIDGNRIVCQDLRNGNEEIYLFELEESSNPVPGFPSAYEFKRKSKPQARFELAIYTLPRYRSARLSH
jgi:beta propeller repeat protein